LVGRYAQVYHLGPRAKKTLGETVRAWRSYLPRFLPVPHPSWHNNRWLAQNPWFEGETVPALRDAVERRLNSGASPGKA
jgi:uracil-DNA glycosylase